jgi:hypothetical protein
VTCECDKAVEVVLRFADHPAIIERMSTGTVTAPTIDSGTEYGGLGLLRIPKEAHTLAGFRRWVLSDEVPEKLPVTFLKGEVYVDMSQEEIFHHALVKTAIAGRMFNLNEDDDFGHLFINGVLVTNKAAGVSNNPDMAAIFWRSLAKGLCKYTTRGKRGVEIVGSPDWLLEIVSDSSVFKDKQQLRQAYHEAGVREYWIIDARSD